MQEHTMDNGDSDLDLRLAEWSRQEEMPALSAPMMGRVRRRLKLERRVRRFRRISVLAAVCMLGWLPGRWVEDRSVDLELALVPQAELRQEETLSDRELAEIFAAPPVEMFRDFGWTAGSALTVLEGSVGLR